MGLVPRNPNAEEATGASLQKRFCEKPLYLEKLICLPAGFCPVLQRSGVMLRSTETGFTALCCIFFY